MKSFLPKRIAIALFIAIPFVHSAQVITNVNTSSQNCQGDTITVTFAVTAPFNPGNQFRVELSDGTPPVFSGTFIEITPLTAASVGSYSMDAVIPDTTTQGVYCIRIIGSDPIVASDTVCNIIVGRNPVTDITIFGTYSFGTEQRFCAGDTAYLVGPPPPLGETHQYQWLLGGSPLAGETDDTLIVTASGIYSVEVTLGLCSSISPDTLVNAYTPPAFVFSTIDPAITIISNVGVDSIQMCEGTIAELNAPTSAQPGLVDFKYQWLTDSVDFFGNPILYALPGDTNQTLLIDSAGTFYVEVTEVNGGCVDTSTVFSVFVDTIPQSNIVNVPWPGQNFATLNLCFEDSTMLTALDTIPYPNWEYQWQISFPSGSASWINLPNDTIPWLQVDTAIVADTADYRLIITNGTCEYISDSLTVNFINDPIFQFFPADSVATCAGDSVLVQLIGNGLSYEWDDGFIGANRWMTDAGDYPVEAIGINGCTTWDTLKVGIFEVNADAGPDLTINCGETAQLTATGGVEYFWFADLPVYFNNQFIANPLTQPTADTTLYFVQVTGPNGCSAIDSVWVYCVDTTTNPGEFSNVQNVITPNNDGRNDVLNIPELLQGDECEFIVLNRWGEEVYRVDNYMNNWNGVTTGGAELPDGTYYYIVKFNDEIRYKGPVTIFRNTN
jgi:gliding motility-associated-like protein